MPLTASSCRREGASVPLPAGPRRARRGFEDQLHRDLVADESPDAWTGGSGRRRSAAASLSAGCGCRRRAAWCARSSHRPPPTEALRPPRARRQAARTPHTRTVERGERREAMYRIACRDLRAARRTVAAEGARHDGIRRDIAAVSGFAQRTDLPLTSRSSRSGPRTPGRPRDTRWPGGSAVRLRRTRR